MEKIILVLLVAALVVVGFGECVKAQVISGINSSSVGNGDSITIAGSGFGIKSQIEPLISSYDSGSDSFHEMSTGASPTGNWAMRDGDYINIGESSSYHRTANYQQDKYVDVAYTSGRYPSLRYTQSSTSNKYHYVSWWWYVTENDFVVSAASWNSKYFSWYTGNGWRVENFYCEGGGSVTSAIGSSDNQIGDPDNWISALPASPWQTWHHSELWAYTGTTDITNGFWHYMVDGKKIRRWGDVDPGAFGMISTARPHVANYFMFGQVSGINNEGGSMLISDVYIDNTQAHVFISNKSDITGNWDNVLVTHNKEVQVASTWSNDSITFTVNQGSLPNSTAYLYVVDADGTISNGYPITFGTSDTTPPTRSNGQPTGTLPSGTTITNISLSTSVQAVCRYSLTPDTNYTDMPFNFTYTNSTNHSSLVTGLENGKTYIYHVRCNSSEGYVNDDDFNISFSIGGHKADTNDDGVIDMPELMVFIGRWTTGDGVTKQEVEEARGIWFTGGVC